MTEIKMPFANVEVKKVVDDKKPANVEGLELKVSPIPFDKFFEEVPPNSSLGKIELAFFDGAEKEIYNELLDEKKFRFELSFEKEKVNFCVLGEEEREVDDTKIEINYLRKDGIDDILRVLFKPQFAGIVKITHRDSEQEPNKDKNNGGGNQNSPSDNSKETKQKIANLQNQINTLEEKLRKQPSSDNSSEDQKKLERLKTEVENLKRKQKDKPPKENKEQDKKDNFPTGLVIGGGIAIFLLLIAVIFF
jgi:hypothetical protein